jgi:hypothetical protein
MGLWLPVGPLLPLRIVEDADAGRGLRSLYLSGSTSYSLFEQKSPSTTLVFL